MHATPEQDAAWRPKFNDSKPPIVSAKLSVPNQSGQMARSKLLYLKRGCCLVIIMDQQGSIPVGKSSLSDQLILDTVCVCDN